MRTKALDFAQRALQFAIAKPVLTGLILFVLLVGLHTHGFSIGAWHELIDDSQERETLLGQYRGWRADDWSIEIPLSLAQASADPQFPVLNKNIGHLQKMTGPFRVPVSSWVGLFKPTTWGYFLTPDLGLSWAWWFLYFSNFFSFFFLLKLLFPQMKNGTSLLFSFLYIYSPFLQYWSFFHAEIYAMCMWGVVAFVKAIDEPRPLLRTVLTGLAVWCLSAAVLGNIYPPRIVPMFYFVGTILLVILATRWREQRPLPWGRISVVTGLTGLASAGLILYFLKTNFDLVGAIQSTRYPGQRVSTGGGFPLSSLLSNWFFENTTNLLGTFMGNKCEDSSFFLLFPLSFAVVAFSKRKLKLSELPPLIWLTFLCLLFLLSFMILGFPPWLAKISFLSHSAVNRPLIVVGLFDLLLLAFVVSSNSLKSLSPLAQKSVFIFQGALWLVQALVLFQLASSKWMALPLLLLFSLHLYFLYRFIFKAEVRKFLFYLLIISLLNSVTWNPLAVGGTDFIFHNQLSTLIQTEDKNLQGQSNWLVLSEGHISNLPRMLNVRSLGGYLTYPNWDMLKTIDPSDQFVFNSNQSAYVYFSFVNQDQASIASPGNGVVVVSLPPTLEILKKLGVTHLLAAGENNMELIKNSPTLAPSIELVGQVHKFSVFRIK